VGGVQGALKAVCNNCEGVKVETEAILPSKSALSTSGHDQLALVAPPVVTQKRFALTNRSISSSLTQL